MQPPNVNPQSPSQKPNPLTQAEYREAVALLVNDSANGELDALCAAGVFEPEAENVLVRAVTDEDYARAKGLEYTGEADCRTAKVFEIVALGPDVPKSKARLVGRFSLALATCLNPVNGMGRSRYALVHHDTVGGSFDGATAKRFLAAMEERKAARRAKSNGLDLA